MPVFALTSTLVQVGVAWTGAAPGGTVTPTGTITTPIDISAYLTSVELSFESDELDHTSFGSGGYRQKITGLATGTISLTINQDFDASRGDSVFGLGGTVGWAPGQSTPYFIDVRATSAARSAGTPLNIAGGRDFVTDFVTLATVSRHDL